VLLFPGIVPRDGGAQLAAPNRSTAPGEQLPVTVHPAQGEQLSVKSSSTWYEAAVNGAGQERFPLAMMQAEYPAGAVPLQTASLLDGGTSQECCAGGFISCDGFDVGTPFVHWPPPVLVNVA